MGVAAPALIAHRGYPRRYPENTLESLDAGLRSGACFVEFDVQLTADGVPVLLHDPDLSRTAGVNGRVMDTPYERLRRLAVGQRPHYGNAAGEVRIPTLREALELLSRWPGRKAFVEVKPESIERFGTDAVLAQLISLLEPQSEQTILISFRLDTVQAAREKGSLTIGWVLERWNDFSRRAAEALRPAYLFCNHKLVPGTAELWPGPWEWALFTVNDPELALRLAARGARFIETDTIKELLADPRFAPGACRDQ